MANSSCGVTQGVCDAVSNGGKHSEENCECNENVYQLCCVACNSSLVLSKHRMLCGHCFCTKCFNDVKMRYENEKTDQYCPVDGKKIDIENSYLEQVQVERDNLETQSTLLHQLYERLPERDDKMNSISKNCAEVEKGIVDTKEKTEQLIKLIKDRAQNLENMKEKIRTSREGMLSLSTDLKGEVAKSKKSLKLEKKEINSVRGQWTSLDCKTNEYAKKYHAAVDNLNKALKLIYDDTDDFSLPDDSIGSATSK